MGFEPTTLRDLVRCYTTELLETTVSKGQFVGLHWSRIAPLQSIYALRTFARKFSNIDFFLKILPLKDNELVLSEM